MLFQSKPISAFPALWLKNSSIVFPDRTRFLLLLVIIFLLETCRLEMTKALETLQILEPVGSSHQPNITQENETKSLQIGRIRKLRAKVQNEAFLVPGGAFRVLEERRIIAVQTVTTWATLRPRL
jgi:hypothetical protein